MLKIVLSVEREDLELLLATIELGADVLTNCAGGHDHEDGVTRLRRLWHEVKEPLVDAQMDELMDELKGLTG